MNYHGIKLIVSMFTVILMIPAPAMAAKEKFERNKPHVNVGTIGSQEQRFLIHNEETGPDSNASCHSSGTLTGQEITPGEPPRLLIIAEDVEIEPGGSVAMLIKDHPHDSASLESIADRREFSIEFKEDGNSLGPCSLLGAVVGYNSSTEATEYYIDASSNSRGYQFKQQQNASVDLNNTPVFGLFLGFVGGNDDQLARFILDTREDPDAKSPGKQCDLSGRLKGQAVRVWGDPHVSTEQFYSIELQQGRVIVDSEFSEFSAGPKTRVDVAAFYEFSAPLKLGTCANFLDFSIQIINKSTGETATRYRPQFYHHWTETGF